MSSIQIDTKQHRQIFIAGKTQWRAYMNLHSAYIHLEAPVLDIGSGEYGTASYQRYIPDYASLNVQSVDLDPNRMPTKVANLEDGIPYEDAEFQTVLCFGVLEYLYDFEKALREMFRVLRPDGRVYIAVPFLDRVASDDGDAVRLTARGLGRALTNAGFVEVEITPYGTGAVGAALDQIEFIIPRFLRGTALRVSQFLDRRITRRSGGKYRNGNDYPLGYMVSARKFL